LLKGFQSAVQQQAAYDKTAPMMDSFSQYSEKRPLKDFQKNWTF